MGDVRTWARRRPTTRRLRPAGDRSVPRASDASRPDRAARGPAAPAPARRGCSPRPDRRCESGVPAGAARVAPRPTGRGRPGRARARRQG
ncbi:hypothetical protein B7G68_18575 [Caulobacter segnis]|uniref:Uncharacterized protein n=1 Tax=Caulobacter segnis TaxID=88688 RepID=A0ABM6TKG9_9CAUL|nr:hypothetical protein B7G68_18575 [Caulobacter segnis]